MVYVPVVGMQGIVVGLKDKRDTELGGIAEVDIVDSYCCHSCWRIVGLLVEDNNCYCNNCSL